MTDVPVRHLYVEYKFWIERNQPFKTVREELETLARQRDYYRRLLEPEKGDVLFGLATFMNSFEMSTAYPVLLSLLESKIGDSELKTIGRMLESYIVRRSVCGLTSKNYTRNMLGIIRAVEGKSAQAEAVYKYLSELKGPSAEWPTDQAFRSSWETSNAFQALNNPKMVFVMKRLSDSYLGPKHESVSIDSPLTVEHIMPQKWVDCWPLSDGSGGLSDEQLLGTPIDDPAYEGTVRRNAIVQTFGNLTIVSQPLNSSVSNGDWLHKKPELMKFSLLPINQQLAQLSEWDEVGIADRGRELFGRALEIWPFSL